MDDGWVLFTAQGCNYPRVQEFIPGIPGPSPRALPPKETTNTLGTPGLCEQFTKPGVGEYASNSAVHWERAEPTYP